MIHSYLGEIYTYVEVISLTYILVISECMVLILYFYVVFWSRYQLLLFSICHKRFLLHTKYTAHVTQYTEVRSADRNGGPPAENNHSSKVIKSLQERISRVTRADMSEPTKEITKVTKPVPAHPKYSQMISDALVALKERNGSSRQKIAKYIQANYSVGEGFESHLKLALRRGVSSGLFVHTKGVGAAGSFKLVKKDVVKPKKPVAKKPKTVKAKTAVKPKPVSDKPKVSKPKSTDKKKSSKPKSKSPAKPKKTTTNKPKTAKTATKKPTKKPATKSAKKQ